MPKLRGHLRDSSSLNGQASTTPSKPSGRHPMLNPTFKKLLILAVLVCGTLPNSGCKLLFGFTKDAFIFADFWYTTPLIPVTPYFSQQVEDTYWEEERYGKVPILDPVEGENAPLFCLDPPSADEIRRALPDPRPGGVPFLAETKWNNMRMVTELIVDRLDECRFYPMAGPARMHHCHWCCTVWYEETKQSWWPIPFTFTEERQEKVYIDHDHLIRCAGPPSGCNPEGGVGCADCQ